eukprot:2563450-Amphidinium_carterae.1
MNECLTSSKSLVSQAVLLAVQLAHADPNASAHKQGPSLCDRLSAYAIQCNMVAPETLEFSATPRPFRRLRPLQQQ